MPALETLYQAYPHFQLKIVSDQFLRTERLPVIEKRWSSEDEQSDLKSFDIGVMPLSDDLWSRGKCGLKILQYYSVGVPVVCTPVGVNRDIVEDGVNGFWAANGDQWEHHLLELMKDEAMRKKMGLKGRERVEAEFSLEVNVPRLLGVLRKVLS
jgi:glycosyltransferase involved in cell wall biosynthesis